MGKAIVISGADFSAAGIGQVTPTEYRELLSISLEEGATVGNRVTIDVTYNPHNATYKELIWSIESGSEYATINNGVLTVLDGADNSPVTVKAVSAYDESIYDTITVYVTSQPIVIYDNLRFDGASGVDTGINVSGSHKIEVNYTAKQQLSASYNYRIILGGRETSSSNRRDIQYYVKASGTNVDYSVGIGTTTKNFASKPLSDGDTVTVISSPTYVAVNNDQQTVSIPTFDLELTYYVGCQHQADGDTSKDYYIFDTIHYVKIWDANDNLIAHFVPAIYNNVEPGLYDKIGGTFHGNIKSGTLIAD